MLKLFNLKRNYKKWLRLTLFHHVFHQKKRNFFWPSLFSSSMSLSFKDVAKYFGKKTISFSSSTMIECLQSSFFANLFLTIRKWIISWWPRASFEKPLYGFISLASCNFKRALIFYLKLFQPSDQMYRMKLLTKYCKLWFLYLFISKIFDFQWIVFFCDSINENVCDWCIIMYLN